MIAKRPRKPSCHRPRQNMRLSPSFSIASNKIHSVDNSTVLTCLTLHSGSEKTSITTSHFACLQNSYANNHITVYDRSSWPSVSTIGWIQDFAQLQPKFKLSLWRENCGTRWVCDVRIVEQDTSFGMLNKVVSPLSGQDTSNIIDSVSVAILAGLQLKLAGVSHFDCKVFNPEQRF